MPFQVLSTVLFNGPLSLPVGSNDRGPFTISDAVSRWALQIDRWIGPSITLRLEAYISTDGGATWDLFTGTGFGASGPDAGDAAAGGTPIRIWGDFPPGINRRVKLTYVVVGGTLSTNVNLSVQ